MRFPRSVLAMLLIGCFGTQTALGVGVVFLHSGDADPVTEGFSIFNLSTQPIADDGGFAAWQTTSLTDRSSHYKAPLSTIDMFSAYAEGWKLSARFRVVEDGPHIGAYASFLGRPRFDLFLSQDESSGDTVVTLWDGVSPNTDPQGLSTVLTDTSTPYPLFELVFDPLRRAADLYIDGQLTLTNYPGNTSYSGNHVLFGGGQEVTARFNLVQFEVGTYQDLIPGDRLACDGFMPPMQDAPVRAEADRLIPLRMTLTRGDGAIVTASDLAAPPVLQVTYQSYGVKHFLDMPEVPLPSGNGSAGNQFAYSEEGVWQFDLAVDTRSAAGLYEVTVRSGDKNSYRIDPSCVTWFATD